MIFLLKNTRVNRAYFSMRFLIIFLLPALVESITDYATCDSDPTLKLRQFVPTFYPMLTKSDTMTRNGLRIEWSNIFHNLVNSVCFDDTDCTGSGFTGAKCTITGGAPSAGAQVGILLINTSPLVSWTGVAFSTVKSVNGLVRNSRINYRSWYYSRSSEIIAGLLHWRNRRCYCHYHDCCIGGWKSDYKYAIVPFYLRILRPDEYLSPWLLFYFFLFCPSKAPHFSRLPGPSESAYRRLRLSSKRRSLQECCVSEL